MRSISVALVTLVVGILAPANLLWAPPLDANFTQQSPAYATGLGSGTTGITGLAWAPDGSNRLFVIRQNGEVRIIQNGTLLGTPFATMTVDNFSDNEVGLLGICFDPRFDGAGPNAEDYVYFFATVSTTRQHIIRWTANGNTGTNQQVILGAGSVILPTAGNNHNGGGLGIGPDMKIYWAIGDQGSGTGLNNNNTLAAKVGRANLDGSAPDDNPYYNLADTITATDYIWARNFRNPFTMTFHPSRGDLWINVVGTNFEQIFLVPANGNAGYTTENNTSTTNGLLIPKLAYPTNGGTFGGCISGGAFYNSTAFPAQYQGNFFFTDFNSGKVMRSVVDASNNITSTVDFVTGLSNPVDTTVGPDGALYYAIRNGTVHRLYYNASQNFIVTPTTLGISEGGSGTFTVRLSQQPASNVTVSVARTSGDADINVTMGSSLTFTTTNWNTTQTVTVAASEDADVANDSATLTVSSTGIPNQLVTVNATDNDTQTFTLSASALTINEGASGTFTVRLSNMPASNVTVTSSRSSGDSDITVTGGGTLTFTSANYATPQTVTVSAAQDADAANDTAVISVQATGIATRTVNVTATDDDPAAPVITTPADTTATEGSPYTYDVDATGAPAPTYSLTTAPAGMTINSTTGMITWTTPGTPGSYNVTVQATNASGPISQTFALVVSANTPPAASITLPTAGAVVSGTNAEFFGDGLDGPDDDAGTVRAEFSIDGGAPYVDPSAGGHYHMGGGHGAWNTTLLSDGPHVLRMTVFDASGASGFMEITVTVANGTGSGLAHQQDSGPDGIVSIEAENYESTAPSGTHSWQPETGFMNLSVSAMRAMPADATNIDTNYAATSPRLDYLVNFDRTGIHYVWAYGVGPTGASDSVHVGLDGAETATSARISGFTIGNTASWANLQMPIPPGTVAVIDVPSTGVHAINIWMREAGFVVDKLVLTSNAGYTPTGLGPPESTRLPAGGGGPVASGSGGGGCGLTGLEALLALALLRRRRK